MSVYVVRRHSGRDTCSATFDPFATSKSVCDTWVNPEMFFFIFDPFFMSSGTPPPGWILVRPVLKGAYFECATQFLQSSPILVIVSLQKTVAATIYEDPIVRPTCPLPEKGPGTASG